MISTFYELVEHKYKHSNHPDIKFSRQRNISNWTETDRVRWYPKIWLSAAWAYIGLKVVCDAALVVVILSTPTSATSARQVKSRFPRTVTVPLLTDGKLFRFDLVTSKTSQSCLVMLHVLSLRQLLLVSDWVTPISCVKFILLDLVYPLSSSSAAQLPGISLCMGTWTTAVLHLTESLSKVLEPSTDLTDFKLLLKLFAYERAASSCLPRQNKTKCHQMIPRYVYLKKRWQGLRNSWC